MNHRSSYHLLAAALVLAAACSSPGANDHAFEWANQLPAGATVHFRDGAGNISVRRADGQSGVVTGGLQWRRSHASDVHFRVNHFGNDYYVCAMWRGSGECGGKGYRGRHMSGLLTMFSLFHHNNDATADIEAQVPANVTVDARTDLGSVTVDGIAAGVTAHSTLGTVRASNVSGPLTLSTTNGDVVLATDSLAPGDPIQLTTTNGTVRAQLPSSIQGAFDLSVVNGSVSSELPLPDAPRGRAGHHLKGQIGESSRLVKMRAVNGTVAVSTRGGHEH